MYYVYKFLNKKDKILYIGRTKDIKKRMVSHFSTGENKIWKNNITSILYIEFELYGDSIIYETYLIHKLKPTYNKLGTEEGLGTSIELPENLNWIEYKKINKAILKRNNYLKEKLDTLSESNKCKPSEFARNSIYSLYTVRKYLKSNKINKRDLMISAINNTINHLKINNMKINKGIIAKKVGISYSTLKKYIKETNFYD